MIVTRERHKARKSFGPVKTRSRSRIELIHSSFSSKKLSRQFPLLAGFHSAVDGALIGVLISVGLMSTLALHWQHLWTVAFTKLESSRDLSHRLIDSTALIESNLLNSKNTAIGLVPTKAENILYLSNPFLKDNKKTKNSTLINFIKNIDYYPVNKGY